MTNGIKYGGERDDSIQDVPVAIVGMACRLAGSATNPEALWQMLHKGKSGWSRGAGTRFNLASFYHPSSKIDGTFNAQGMHLLKQDISHFDNQMFGTSAVEAKAIDPQQRLLLEVAYEAFESAGMLREDLRSSDTGVYAAVFNHDYESIQSRDPEISPSYRFTGTGPAIVSNRISYAFDLRGPSVTLDTACSGSLVAVHQACQAIRNGEIRQAVVGGTNLILDPEYMASMSSMQVLSDHGRCYAFDSRAGGFGRGEGVAAIIVKRLDDAIRDGDSIRSIIRGSATNQDGKTPGITMPSHEAQVKVIKKAYAQAGLDPCNTCYVEAHGTGTKVGDKTESAALAECFTRQHIEAAPLYVGSVKTNVGHTESVAGLAGLLKAVLVLEKGVIPPNLNFAKVNQEIPLAKWQIQIPQKPIPWPENQARRASVNSFGYGGSNAHVILDSPEQYLKSEIIPHGDSSQHNSQIAIRRLYVLSHNVDQGIGKLATNLKRYVEQHPAHDTNFYHDLAHTLNTRRSRLAYRVCFTAVNQDEISSCLENIAKGVTRSHHVVLEGSPRICFAFTGQGAQWAGMGKELSTVYPVFANSLEDSSDHLKMLGADWSLLDELNRPENESRISEAKISQPCCTAIQIALVKLLRSWSVVPNAVCGHSSGEIAAAYAAGYLTAKSALSIAYHRGNAVSNLRNVSPDRKGGMLAVGLGVEEIQRYIRHDSLDIAEEKIVVACINSPTSVTISGDIVPLKNLQSRLELDGVFNRLLVVDVAYHSHHMDIVRDEYIRSMGDLRHSTTSNGVQMVSSVTEELIRPGELDAEYWAQNMVSCVRFGPAVQKAVQLSGGGESSSNTTDAVLELGPHSALAGPIKQSLKSLGAGFSKVKYFSAIVRNTDAVKTVVDLAGGIACLGYNVAFGTINNPTNQVQARLLSDLPTYNWHHTQSHWNEGRVSSQYRFREFPRHDLLGVPCNDSIPLEPRWRNYLRVAEVPWVRGHNFQGQIVFPASGYICAAIEAMRQITTGTGRMWKDLKCHFREIDCGHALLIPDDAVGIETLFSLRPYNSSTRQSSASWKEFRFFSVSPSGEALEHCRGLVNVESVLRSGDDQVINQKVNENNSTSFSSALDISKANCKRGVAPKRFYNDLKSLGVDYSGPFANITKISTGYREALCEVSIPDIKASMPGQFQQPHCIHPATLDMCFQTPFTGLRSAGDMKSTLVITHIEDLEISSDISAVPNSSFIVFNKVQPYGFTKFRASLAVTEEAKISPLPLVKVSGLVYTSALEVSLEQRRPDGEYLCHQMKWAMDVTCAKDNTLHGLCDSKRTDTSATPRRRAYDAYAQKVIHRVLNSISTKDEAQMETHQKHLLRWMKEHKAHSIADVPDISRKEVESLGVDGEMLVRVGDHMLDILRNKTDALTILLQEDLLYRVYSNENTHRCHEQLDKYLELLKFKDPGMNILEIGGGTAGTTVPVLNAFTEWAEDGVVKKSNIKNYVFTDISSGFFEKSAEKLIAWKDILEFKKLDIEANTSEQGFVDGTFDLVIASNVLHATRDIANTLRNVQRLLKPGGKLIMVEITEPHMTWPMIVGTLPGWWLGAAEGRVDGPSLNSLGWDRALRKTGFTGIDLEMKDFSSPYEHQMSVLIATSQVKNHFDSHSPTIHIYSNTSNNGVSDALLCLLEKENKNQKVEQKTFDAFEPSDSTAIVLYEVSAPYLSRCNTKEFENVKQLLTRSKNVLWVTKGATIDCQDPTRALITGLARTARSEDHSLNLVTLDLDPQEELHEQAAASINLVLATAFHSERHSESLPEFEYAMRNGSLLIPRIVADEQTHDYVHRTVATGSSLLQPIRQEGRSLELQIGTPGLLETFHWVDSATHSQPPGPEEVRIRMLAAPLNFKDLMTGMGQLDGLAAMLIECGGIVEQVGDNVAAVFQPGDRVCAVGCKSFATTSNVDYRLVQHVPDSLSIEVAAAIQISYATALYTLRDVARLQPGESVLIHSAAGGFGQAAIAIAKYLGAGAIYVTVGSADKKKFITDKFSIPNNHIFSSRSLSFKDGILQSTNGIGVDVVLNSLSGDAMSESYKCLARFGRFVEIGKKDLLSNTRLEMQHLEKNVSLSTVDLSMIMQYKPLAMQELLMTVFELAGKGQLEILSPIITKDISELETAFRLMQAGKHIGKIVMRISDDARVQVNTQRLPLPKVDTESSYLVIGGTGGLGKAIIRHLVKIGVKHILTMSRSGSKDAEVLSLIEECRNLGTDLVVQKGSVLSMVDLQATVKLAGKRTIRGVIQGAMVLQDTIINNMSFEQWQAAVLPKVQGTMNLHAIFGESLDFFIMLSSGTGIIGSFGQGNYAAGNTFQDAFARWRTSHGLPARTIDLGPVEGEGYAAENENALEFTLRQGMGIVKLDEVMSLINHAIAFPLLHDVAASQTLAATRRADPTSGTDEAAVQRVDPKFSHLWTSSSTASRTVKVGGEFDFKSELRSATTFSTAVDAAQTAIINKLSKLLAMQIEDISAERPVGSYGMDSLISVELRNWMSVQLEAAIQQFELMSAKSIRDLASMATERSRLVAASIVATK